MEIGQFIKRGSGLFEVIEVYGSIKIRDVQTGVIGDLYHYESDKIIASPEDLVRWARKNENQSNEY